MLYLVIICVVGCVLWSGLYLYSIIIDPVDSFGKNLLLLVLAMLPSFVGYIVFVWFLESRNWLFLKALALTIVTTALSYCLFKKEKK
ncbi:MAG: hypothetical protein US63_C0006G0020 [Candidatus Moranbacteria bacterium GW2011_GWC2_37_8]|nr:MAG: hypothetical protein US63_C0006G0020 [Candidatus Moranbacteria bacterium GW2011_GWC2_37_8]KKQ62446.1 MAG: hypothetical protein US82_C0011G0020 [Parcubacteria group bacterium GW2011_GWC1_38_22]